jgi:hypothetical protein
MHTPAHKHGEDEKKGPDFVEQKKDPSTKEGKDQIPVDPAILERRNPVFLFCITELEADTFANDNHIPKQTWEWLRDPAQLNVVMPYPKGADVYEIGRVSELPRYQEIRQYALAQNCNWIFPAPAETKKKGPEDHLPREKEVSRDVSKDDLIEKKRESLHPPVSPKMQEPKR